MNIHPAFVHFPIALLMIYAVLELVSRVWPKLQTQAWVEPLKAFLAIFGSLSAMVTLSTGEAAENALGRGTQAIHQLIEIHSSFASAATWIFSVIGVIYLLRIIRRQSWYAAVPALLQRLFACCLYLLDRGWLITLAAIAGLIAMTITGALGGAIVYGPDADPVIHAVYGIFF